MPSIISTPQMAATIDSPTENQPLSNTQYNRLLETHAKYKDRSHKTHHEVHMPQLQDPPTTPPISTTSTHATASPTKPSFNSPTVETVLLGDSMIERFKTTGQTTGISPSWPSTVLLGSSAIERLKSMYTASALRAITSVFNAGVGGDKIENILYRLSGPQGLCRMLQGRPVKLYLVCAGTNNLKPKDGVESVGKYIQLYRLILQALLRIERPGAETTTEAAQDEGGEKAVSRIQAYEDALKASAKAKRKPRIQIAEDDPAPEVKPAAVAGEKPAASPSSARVAPKAKILVCGIFYRKDIPDTVVDAFNAGLEKLAKEMNARLGDERIVYLPPPESITKGMLVDHVHLGVEGYRIWTEYLVPKMNEALAGPDGVEGVEEGLRRATVNRGAEHRKVQHSALHVSNDRPGTTR